MATSIRLEKAELIDEPAFLAQGFAGYEHFVDPTMMDFSKLTFPSKNCSIPIADKIIPDQGKLLLGQEFTENIGIIGHKEKFKNSGGIEMEVRVWRSPDRDIKDVIEIYFENNRLLFSGLVGTFDEGETIKGGTSGATAIIVSILNTVLTVSNITGDFTVGETITGQSSGATAIVVMSPISIWRPITEDPNPITWGEHEVYMDEWFDTNLDPALSLRLPRLIWVNGNDNGTLSPDNGFVYSWTGGIALITAVTATNITIDASTTWRSLGFTEDTSTSGAGNAYVIVNQTKYTLVDPAELDTNSINVTSTVGAAVGDFATSRIEIDESPIPFDVCRQNKGYMFYGNWDSRDLYQSNAFNRSSEITISSFSGGLLNDLIIPDSANYTGTVEATYTVTIDTVTPEIDIEEQTFTGVGTGNGSWDTSSYSGGTDKNTYRMVAVTDYVITGVTASMVPAAGNPAWIDQVFIGATSGAVGIAIGGQYALSFVAPMRMLSGTFIVGETITGQTTGATVTTLLVQTANNFQLFKNGVQVISTSIPFYFFPAPYYAYPASLDGVPSLATIVLPVDGLSFNFANPVQLVPGDYYELVIQRQPQQPDTFKWKKDSGAFSGSIAITTNNQSLSDGVQIRFGSEFGHSVGDTWIIKTIPAVTRAWVNFYYALPIRKPGEGYIYRLPSNFWTMDTQEESMYINGSFGEWSVVSTVLSGDLQSEDVSLTPLKQVGALKVIYPYMTSHINDDLIFVTVDKRLMSLGREPFLEKPQSSFISKLVDLDFQASSFVGGSIKYLDRRLYISSPEDSITHCYDLYQEYWQPPKTFPEVGILSVVGNSLICHSNTRNQSFTMFAGGGNGDNGASYEVEVRSPYIAPSGRWKSSFSNMAFVEGYITGNPIIQHSVYLEVAGCKDILVHTLDPIVCIAENNAPLGEGALGSHPLGSDAGINGNYFKYLEKGFKPVMQYYFASIGLLCAAKNHSYAYLTYGLNGMISPSGNNALTSPQNVVT